jgi:hypothetical protein
MIDELLTSRHRNPTPPRVAVNNCAVAHGWHLSRQDHCRCEFRRGGDSLAIKFDVDGRPTLVAWLVDGQRGQIHRHDKGKQTTSAVS